MITELNPAGPDARGAPRTSLFVMATLYADSGSSPVKVRDVSPAGALIEGENIPAPGMGIRLSRGSISICGEIIWCRGGRAGLRSESTVTVADWLPGRQSRTAQERVDRVVQQVKVSGTLRAPPTASVPSFMGSRLSTAELMQLRKSLESLAEDLAADPDIVKRHTPKLQILDLTAQALRKLVDERGSPD